MKCPKCSSKEVYPEEGYESIFRCLKCNRVGTREDFDE